jgi:hypothetical protein
VRSSTEKEINEDAGDAESDNHGDSQKEEICPACSFSASSSDWIAQESCVYDPLLALPGIIASKL